MKRLCLVAGVLLLGAVAHAGPNTITYQGYVATAGEKPVPDGTYAMQFNLYIVPSGGTWVWQEIETSVTVKNGLFSVILGDGRPFGTLFTTRSDLWLEIWIDLDHSKTFTTSERYWPRQKLSGAAWAIAAADADTLDGKHASAFGDITGVTAGLGLSGGGTSGTVALSANTTYLQRRVTSTAAAGQYIRQIKEDGSITTGTDQVNPGTITGVTAGLGLSGGGTSGTVALSANTTYLQRRVTGTAPTAQFIQAINGDGTVVTSSAITGVAAGAGLTGGGTSGSVTLSADAAYLQRRVTGAAPAGQFIQAINADGSVVSGNDRVGTGTITGVTAGLGLSGGGTSGTVALSADTTYVQRRVTGTAPTAQFIRAVNADGTVVTTSAITGVGAGMGLTGGGTSGSVTLSADSAYLQRRVTGTAPPGRFITAINDDGAVVAAEEMGDISSVTAGTGLTGGGLSGDVGLAVRFGGSGTSTSAARADHAHNPLVWAEVTGTSQQAEANRGYIANNASTVTITLPTSPSLAVGDVIRVSGAGAGGWKIAQNPGQRIRVRNLGIPDWTARESDRGWAGVASSADGTKLVAGVYGGQVYTSWNSGLTWTARELNRAWTHFASSADGTKLVAGVDGDQIHTSWDSGVTWTGRGSSRVWAGVASSADGTKLVACVVGGQIYTSSDSGVNWTPRESNRGWVSVASSAYGTELVACVNGGYIYTSSDSGTSWTARMTDTNRAWYFVASSADASKLVACVYGGQIYTSSDSGVNWTARESNRNWMSVASSADGTKLVACGNGGQIYTSSDSGVTWTAQESNRRWWCVASSADGTKLVACVNNGQIYTSSDSGTSWTAWTDTTVPGTDGYLSGGQGAAVELQYVGSDTFVPISYIGPLEAN